MNNLEAAEDALATFYANARISKNIDKEQEASLIASVNHAKSEIQKFDEDKKAFWEKFYSDENALMIKQKKEYDDFCNNTYIEAKRLGYDN